LKFAAHSLKLAACSSWLVEKAIELNVRSPGFAGFCQINPQIQFNFCLDAETGLMLLSGGVSLK
jgi:hypothetical protein